MQQMYALFVKIFMIYLVCEQEYKAKVFRKIFLRENFVDLLGTYRTDMSGKGWKQACI